MHTLALAVALALPAASPAEVQHPFLLWDRADVARLKKLVESQDWAKRRFEQMADPVPGATTSAKGAASGAVYKNLFAYVVLGDKAAGRAEKQALMRFANERPEGKSTYYSPFIDVLRYDAIYDELTPAERGAVEAAFRAFIDWHLTQNKFAYSREFWLPNMQWNRVMGTHLMAVALRDEKLIRAMFASNGGWKFYFDDYVADGAFYFEEFGKQYSMLSEMMLWCRGVERLGVDELGFGYRGRGGATMRSYLEAYLIHLSFPWTDQGSSRPALHRVTMGDAGTLHATIAGYTADGRGGTSRYSAAKMNGGVPRMVGPLVYEFAHAKWPDAGFDYFLARERGPDEDKCYPSLIFLSAPIDPANVKPPATRSFVAAERGFAFLKADDSSGYFESPAPTVPLQLATYYMHYTAEPFSLLGFHAFHRPLYQRTGRSRGYAGGCPWTDSVRSNCGVVVDGLRAKSVGPVPTRQGFYPEVKFVAARGNALRPYPPVPPDEQAGDHNQRGTYVAMRRSAGPEIYPGVDLERSLFLTREYLCDFYRLRSDRPREYHWQVQAIGWPKPTDTAAWQPGDEINAGLYDKESMFDGMLKNYTDDPQRYHLKDVRKRDAGAINWSLDLVQTWTRPAYGVCLRMLGAQGTRLYTGTVNDVDPSAANDDKPRHTTLIVARQTPATLFAALHEPTKDRKSQIASFTAIQETAEAVGVAVRGTPGSGIDDRVLYQFFGAADGPVALSDGQDSFTFADHAWLRIGRNRIDVRGDLRGLKLRVPGAPKLVVNGQQVPAKVEGGVMTYAAPTQPM